MSIDIKETKAREHHSSAHIPGIISMMRILFVLCILITFIAPRASVADCLFGSCKLSDTFLEQRALSLRFSPRFWPTIPVDQIFACGVYLVNTDTYSPLWYYLNFRDDGSLELSFETNAGNLVIGNGAYTALQALGLLGYEVNMSYVIANQTYQTQFKLGNAQTTSGLKMIRYFDASGEVIENGVQHPIEMYCQSFGHRYNATAHNNYLRFQCPDQVTAGGIYENAFQFNVNAPGSAFRQRDFYATGSSNPIIQRSEAGMFRWNGNDVTIDFNVNPNLTNLGTFSDFNELHGEIVSNGSQLQLVIDEFPTGNNVCNQIP